MLFCHLDLISTQIESCLARLILQEYSYDIGRHHNVAFEDVGYTQSDGKYTIFQEPLDVLIYYANISTV